MKLKEMYEICKNQKGKCEVCKLNCIENWQEEQLTWCLISLKKRYIEQYQKYKAENNEILAERVKTRYEELEKEYLKEK